MIESNIQSAAEKILADHLAPALASQVAKSIAHETVGAVREDIVAYLSGGESNGHTNGNGHSNGHTNGHAKRPRKAATPAGTSTLSDPAKEVMRLKKRLYWALKRQGTSGAQEEDADLIARKDEIDGLSTQDFVQKGLTAESFLKKGRKKAQAAAAAPKAAKGKKAKAARKKAPAPEGLDAVL